MIKSVFTSLLIYTLFVIKIAIKILLFNKNYYWSTLMIGVPPKLLKKTIKCIHNFSCLETGQCGDLIECKVKYPIGQKALILKSYKKVTCPYRINFGQVMICQCPVYYYLYTNGC